MTPRSGASIGKEASTGVCPPCPRLPRKEVIQPQVPLRLPCYDFTPITTHTFGTYLPRTG
jgi:hypothetical protein